MNNLVKLNCHDRCTEYQIHSVCIMPVRLKAPIMAQMLHKVETLTDSRQDEKTLGQYAQVEQIMKRGTK